VDLIVNLAADVNFHERLDYAVRPNTQGPYHLLKFAERCRRAILLHVSTAYVSGRRSGPIPEDPLHPDVSANDSMGVTNPEAFHTKNETARAEGLGESVEQESRTRAARDEFRQSAIAQFRPARMVSEARLDHAVEKIRRRWVRDRLSKEGLTRARRFGWIDTYSFTKAL